MKNITDREFSLGKKIFTSSLPNWKTGIFGGFAIKCRFKVFGSEENYPLSRRDDFSSINRREYLPDNGLCNFDK